MKKPKVERNVFELHFFFQKTMCINETKQLNKHNIYELIQI